MDDQREGEGRGSRVGGWGEVRKVLTSWCREKKGWSARDWRKLGRERCLQYSLRTYVYITSVKAT